MTDTQRALPENSQAGLMSKRTAGSVVRPVIIQPPALADDAITAIPTFKEVA